MDVETWRHPHRRLLWTVSWTGLQSRIYEYFIAFLSMISFAESCNRRSQLRQGHRDVYHYVHGFQKKRRPIAKIILVDIFIHFTFRIFYGKPCIYLAFQRAVFVSIMYCTTSHMLGHVSSSASGQLYTIKRNKNFLMRLLFLLFFRCEETSTEYFVCSSFKTIRFFIANRKSSEHFAPKNIAISPEIRWITYFRPPCNSFRMATAI